MIKAIIATIIIAIVFRKRNNIKEFFIKNPCQELSIKDTIDTLEISEKNKDNLKYYIDKKDEKNKERLFGVALALQDESLITPESFVSLVIKK